MKNLIIAQIISEIARIKSKNAGTSKTSMKINKPVGM
jgi:hypothetical protein